MEISHGIVEPHCGAKTAIFGRKTGATRVKVPPACPWAPYVKARHAAGANRLISEPDASQASTGLQGSDLSGGVPKKGSSRPGRRLHELPEGYGSWWQVVCNVRQEHAGPGGPFGLTPPPSPSPPRRIIDIQEDHGRDGGHVTSATILVLDRRAPNGSPFAVPFSQIGWNAFSKN